MKLLTICAERRAAVPDRVELEVFQVHGRAAHTPATLTTFKEDGFASAFGEICCAEDEALQESASKISGTSSEFI